MEAYHPLTWIPTVTECLSPIRIKSSRFKTACTQLLNFNHVTIMRYMYTHVIGYSQTTPPFFKLEKAAAASETPGGLIGWDGLLVTIIVSPCKSK